MTVESATLRALFGDVARAVIDQLGARGPARAAPEIHQLSVVAGDTGALLLIWLGEIIFHSLRSDRLFAETRLLRISARGLRAELRAEHETRWLADLTSTAITDARVEARDGRFRARVTLDLTPIGAR